MCVCIYVYSRLFVVCHLFLWLFRLSSGQFRKHDNKPYCDEHFNKMFGTTCSKCSKNIEGSALFRAQTAYRELNSTLVL